MQADKKTVIAYLFTHWDFEWYRTAESFNVRLVEVIDDVLEELKTGRAPSFYFDGQVLALYHYLKFRPQKKALIKKLIKEKKLFTGPYFVSGDSFLVSGASLIKNLEIGLKFSKEFGEDEFLGYLSDTFGHSKSIFEALKIFNIKNAIIWRGAPDINADFRACGINVTRLVYGYYQDILHNDNLAPAKKAEILEKILDKINEKSGDFLLLPLGADHMGILKNAKEKIKEINKYLKKYEIKLSNPFEYLKKARYSTDLGEVEFLDNSATYILSGVYSTRIDEKVENSKLQYDLFYKAGVLNYFLGKKYNSELDCAAFELIKNHAHDSIYGCSTDEVAEMVKCRNLKVKETTNAVIKKIIRDFKKENLISSNPDKLGVFNLSNYPVEGVVKIISDKKIKNGQKIGEFKGVDDEILYDIYKNPMTEDFHKFFEYLVEVDEIKPFSFKNFEIKKPVQKQIAGDDFIENPYIKLFISENKIYLRDKITNETFENFIELHSTPDYGDSYNYAPGGYPYILKLKKSKVKTKGKIKSTLEVVFEENIKLYFSLANNSKLCYINVDFINKKKNRKLQIVFNTKSKLYKTLAQNPFGVIERSHDPNYLLYEAMPVKNKEELKTNSYPLNSFVKGNSVSVFTKGLNEYEIYENSLKITLLRSIGIISNPKNLSRKVPAGPPIECSDMQEVGHHNLDLAFGFNFNEDEMMKLSDSFFDPFVAVSGEFKIKNKTWLKNKPGSYFLSFADIGGKKGREPLFIKK